MSEEAIVRQFEVGSGGELIIEAELASIAVQGGSDAVRVAISRDDDDAEDIKEDFDIAFDASASRLRLGIERRSGLLDGLRPRRQLAIEVQTPRQFDVDLATSGGSVRVRHLAGAIHVRTSGGSIRLEDVDGPVDGKTSGGSVHLSGTSGDARLTTSGGSITVGEVDGHVRARTSGGRIAIEHAGGGVSARTTGGSIAIGSGGAVDATTSGGSIQLALTAQPDADSQLRTTGGSIDVHLPSDIALNVDAAASGGRVRIADALAFQGETTKQTIHGSLNDGGPDLHMRTSGGSIRLRALR